ncbi:MAG: hypothetical protein IAB19_02270 [Proteobacteria bacterium]|uniref:Uncharacterized protein n=1 Tax=Candidatus Avisuccinivibrio stercorigallinarum TaxID=2840704 RepID=A0A9D9DB68_9GAMM|nr:hypothetical protein [Candidatus Avisuccinivibrio stercorigallinarum]
MIHLIFSKNGARMCFKNAARPDDLFFAAPEALERINLFELRRYLRGRDFTIEPLNRRGVEKLTAALLQDKTVSWY